MTYTHLFRNLIMFSPVLFGCANEQADQPPNVLFIVVDDLNSTLGCYGHPVVKSPNIDQFAQEGILFRHAYCNLAVCNPSRSSFLTGLLPENLGIIDNRVSLQSVIGDRITLPALFRENGYHTISIGKVFHGRNEHNDPKAWDEIYNFRTTELGQQGVGRNLTDGVLPWCSWLAAEGTDEDQLDGQTAARAVEFINQTHDKPFFLAVGMAKPHDPFNAPKKYFDLYPEEDCDLHRPPEDWQVPHPITLPGETRVFDLFTDQERCEFQRAYYACVSFMDAQVGKVLDALKEQGLMENTLVVFFGDHGYHLGEHNWWNKVTVYEKSHVAPMIIYTGNDKVKGRETNAMIEFIDLYPTLATYCGLDNIPDYLEGKDFGAVLKNPEASFREFVTKVVGRGNVLGRSVKTTEWRYTEWDEGRQGTELYDQINDPLEYNDLSGDPAYDNIQHEMRKLL